MLSLTLILFAPNKNAKTDICFSHLAHNEGSLADKRQECVSYMCVMMGAELRSATQCVNKQITTTTWQKEHQQRIGPVSRAERKQRRRQKGTWESLEGDGQCGRRRGD